MDDTLDVQFGRQGSFRVISAHLGGTGSLGIIKKVLFRGHSGSKKYEGHSGSGGHSGSSITDNVT